MTLPGFTWRVLAHPRLRKPLENGVRYGDPIDLKYKPKDRVEFDELVVGNPAWFHMEQTNDRNWYIRVGPYLIYVYIPSKGEPEVLVERDE